MTTPCPTTTTPCATTATTTATATTTTPTTTTPYATTTTPCPTTTTPCATTTTPCATTTTPCPTTTTPCATTAPNPCDTTAKFMGKYSSKTANGIAGTADVVPPQLGGGQRVLALSAGVLCLAALVALALGALRIRAARSMVSFRQLDQQALMQETE